MKAWGLILARIKQIHNFILILYLDYADFDFVYCISCISSYFQAEKDMIPNLAIGMDGLESLMDADEYLQPKSRAPLPPGILTTNTSVSPPKTPVKTCWPNAISLDTDSPTPQNQQNWDRELFRYNASHGNVSTSHEQGVSEQHGQYVHANGHCGPMISDSYSSRYCSDPLRIVGVRG